MGQVWHHHGTIVPIERGSSRVGWERHRPHDWTTVHVPYSLLRDTRNTRHQPPIHPTPHTSRGSVIVAAAVDSLYTAPWRHRLLLTAHSMSDSSSPSTPSSSSSSYFASISPKFATLTKSFFPSQSSTATTTTSDDTSNAIPLSSLAAITASKQAAHLHRLKQLSQHSQLKKTLDWKHLVSLGIGCTIGAGIFVVTGKVGRDQTGPALFLSYIVSGVTCLFAALCYAEFAAMSPSAGSAYSYARSTMGEVVGWIIGWDLVLEYCVGAATVAQSWSSHLNELLHLMGGSIPAAIARPPWEFDSSTGLVTRGYGIDLFAILITAAVTYVLYRGIKESATFNNAMVAIKLFVVFFVILVGAGFTHSSNFVPFLPYGFAGISFFGHTVAGQTNANGDPSGVLAGAAIVFFAYIGFDAVSCQAEECKQPQRDLPIGIIGSLSISTMLYVAVSLVLVGLVPYQQLDGEVGVAAAFGANGLTWAEYIISIGALVGMTSVLLVTMMGQPRVTLAMARDGLLPMSFFGAVHPKYGTPWKATILTGTVVSLLSSLIPLSILVELVSIGTLLAFFIVCISVLVLRRTQPDVPRPFRCPWSPLIPSLGAFLCLMLMLSLPGSNWYRLAAWLGLGMVVYFWWGRQNARKVKEMREAELQWEVEHAAVEEGGPDGEKAVDGADGGEKSGVEESKEQYEKEEVSAGAPDDENGALNNMRSSDD